MRLPAQDDPDLAPLANTFNHATALEARVRRDERFAGDVSHELRSPLTTMANAAAVLHRRRSEMTGPAARALELLVPEIDRFRRMVVDLLEISREDPASSEELDDVDLGELARGVLGDRAACGVDVDGPAPVVRADRRCLERALAKLVENADTSGEGAIRVGIERCGDRARIEVYDAGPGVPSELRTVVFERFSRGAFAGRRDDGGGSGLVLALVARHVRRHDGEVWVEDRRRGCPVRRRASCGTVNAGPAVHRIRATDERGRGGHTRPCRRPADRTSGPRARTAHLCNGCRWWLGYVELSIWW